MGYKFSLIMVTLGRSFEVEQFFLSLLQQTYKDFELIVVDQNKDNKVFDICEKYKSQVYVKYLKNTIKGISVNRNLGLQYVTGNIIAFPDDDCEYKPDTLEMVNDFFVKNGYDFFTFNFEDNKLSGKKHFCTDKKKINIFNFLSTAISFTIFVKSDALAKFKFDEQLGLGAVYGSREESDMICFLLKNCFHGFYNGSYTIYHRIINTNYTSIDRVYYTSLGLGAFHKKMIIHYKYYVLIPEYIWRLTKNIMALIIMPQKKYFVKTLQAKIEGFIRYKLV